jgi:hypothetical protein
MVVEATFGESEDRSTFVHPSVSGTAKSGKISGIMK